MTYKTLAFQTATIPVYAISGEKEREITLPEKIMPIASKRGGFGESGLYYKGTGIVYRNHVVNEYDKNVKLIDKTNIIYEKYSVCYPHLLGKFGIFPFAHQAIFSDREGACGKKEQALLVNQCKFELSAIDEIIDVIHTGILEHNIYIYRLKKVSACPLEVIRLIEYVLQADYNTAWDKNLWADIYCYTYVRDLADWFVSDKLCHKLGTVYALMSSIYNSDVYLYAMILKELLGVYDSERTFILYFSALIVNRYCPQLFTSLVQDIKEITPELFGTRLKLLFEGKACCHMEEDAKWDWVRDYYTQRIERYIRIFARRIAWRN
mgnify:CR=1 FL=1